MEPQGYRSTRVKWALLCLMVLSTPLIAAEPRGITVVFRYDDYSDQSATPLETRIIRSFQKRHWRVTFAAVPYTCPQDDGLSVSDEGLGPAKALILKKALESNIVDVALHGYCHRSVEPPGNESEFEGVDFATQREELAKGRSYLEEALHVEVAEFVPPWNSYDRNTIRALEQLGFELISAEVPGESSSSSPLLFLPSTTSLRDLRRAVATARRNPHPGQVIVVLFHQFDFREYDSQGGKLSYPQFEELLDWLASQPDVSIRSLGDMAQAGDDLSGARLRENNRIRYCYFELMPPALRLFFGKPTKVYWTTESNLSLTLSLFLAGFYAVLVAFSALTAFSVAALLTATAGYGILRAALRWGGAPLLLAAGVYASWNLELDYGTTLPLAIVFGVCAGSWAAAAILPRGRAMSRLEVQPRADSV